MIDQRLWRLLQASKALITKMDKITNSDAWKGTFVFAYTHGLKWEEDDWADEYEALKYEIETIERENMKHE